MFADPFGDPFGGAFRLMFVVVPILVIGGAVLIFGFTIYSLIHTTVSNRRQPLLTRRARVVAKRMHYSSHHHHHGDHHHLSRHTAYFVTFEFEDGSREEFSVRGDQYGQLVEGDEGTLQSQGTWFKGFHRE